MLSRSRPHRGALPWLNWPRRLLRTTCRPGGATALPLFGPPFGKNGDLPCDPNWRDVLAEAAEHDPDNALYDYLVAQQLWQESIDHDYTEDDFPLVVRDADKFAESAAFFERGKQKRFVRGPDCELSAVQHILSHAGVPRHEQPVVANSRWPQRCETLLLFGLRRGGSSCQTVQTAGSNTPRAP